MTYYGLKMPEIIFYPQTFDMIQLNLDHLLSLLPIFLAMCASYTALIGYNSSFLSLLAKFLEICVTVRLIIIDKLNHSTNSETAMLSKCLRLCVLYGRTIKLQLDRFRPFSSALLSYFTDWRFLTL